MIKSNQNLTEKKRYNLYYTKYNIIANAYIPYVKVIECTDIYHEIGKMICTTFEHIDKIRYTEPKATREECEELWRNGGYVQITPDLWRKEKSN